MFKKIVPVICALVVSVCGVFSTSFDSKASALEFYVPYAEPAKTDNQGYVTILAELNGNYTVFTYFWSTIAVANGVDSPVTMGVYVDSGGINMVPYGSMDSSSAYFNVVEVTANGVYSQKHSSSSSKFSYSLTPWGYRIVGAHCAGNVGDLSFSFSPIEFIVHYSDDHDAKLLMTLLETLYQCRDVSADILNTVQAILVYTDGVEAQLWSVIDYLKSVDSELVSIKSELQEIYAKADEILSEQKKSNTWLEKIFNYLNESAEKQKNEATQQGNNSVSQGTSSIEDKGTGFVDSMGGLVSSMSYSGTNCAWTFPQVKMPAIDGIMEERVLIEEQPIDFTRWINAIPAPILLLIQSALTMGLIVYCFKELYDTISYVLTLRGGGSNE